MSTLSLAELVHLAQGLEPEEVRALIADLPEPAVTALLDALGTTDGPSRIPNPLAQALSVDAGYRPRAHLEYVSKVIAEAVADVEQGHSRRLIIEMPPRSGKSTLCTQHTPAWLLREHPSWPIALVSHDPSLAVSWGRQIRRWVEAGQVGDVQIAPDAGAVSEWQTTAGGGVLSRSTRGSLTGRGAKVMLIDDPHKDFVEAHSEIERQRVWDWWLSVAQTRLEPPSLVIVVMTRWHEDDLVGRLLSTDHEGDPDDWTVVRIDAVAEDEDDVLGRAPGEPLISPLLDETVEEAASRWEEVKRAVGTYVWSALYQQRPAPAGGSIFDVGWWRYWTTDPGKVSADGRVVLLPDIGPGATQVESWDMAFKDTKASDYVVGQRWARIGPNRFLLAQVRGRWSFTETLRQVQEFADPHVPTRLVEDKANGTAVLDTLREVLDGLIPINPKDGKEARARAVTPEVEAGNVLLPHPSEEVWVNDLLSELRHFPHDAHDDQVDALTQALMRLRNAGGGQVTVPGRLGRTVARRALSSSPRRRVSAS